MDISVPVSIHSFYDVIQSMTFAKYLKQSSSYILCKNSFSSCRCWNSL